MINVSDHANRVLNIVKAKYGFSNKSEAIEFVVKKFEEEDLEEVLKPINCAIASEKALAEYTDNEIEDEAWKNL